MTKATHISRNGTPETNGQGRLGPFFAAALVGLTLILGGVGGGGVGGGGVALAKSGRVELKLLGLRVLDEDTVRKFAGRPARCSKREEWAGDALRRIVHSYRKRGYRYARGWYDLGEDCEVRIEIDEGVMKRVVFAGASTYQAFLLRVDLNLPKNVFHGPTLRKAMQELKKKHDLLNAYYRVRETPQGVETELGALVPQRVLKVYVVTPESYGWSVGVELDSTWGVVPSVGVSFRDVIFDNDRLNSELSLAIPYREYVFNENPQAQWVHGEVGLGYRLPPLGGGHVAPRLSGRTAVSQYHREDVGLRRFFLLRTPAALEAVLLFPPTLTISLGGGLEYDYVFEVDRLPDDNQQEIEGSLLRATALLDVEVVLDPEILRRDQRDTVRLEARFASAGEGDWMVDTRLQGAVFFHLGLHDLIFRTRGLYITGDVRFWDEQSLAGSYQRVFFDNRYWVREAFQLVAAFRLAIWEDTVKLGVYHDLSLFLDRSRGGRDFAVADAFGPSLHFLMFDMIAFDIYYGFGFADVGFDHNLSFKLQTVF